MMILQKINSHFLVLLQVAIVALGTDRAFYCIRPAPGQAFRVFPLALLQYLQVVVLQCWVVLERNVEGKGTNLPINVSHFGIIIYNASIFTIAFFACCCPANCRRYLP